jgi:hypothetical protein
MLMPKTQTLTGCDREEHERKPSCVVLDFCCRYRLEPDRQVDLELVL